MTDDKRVEEIVTSTRLTTEKKVLAILKLIEEAEKKARVEEMIRMSKTKNFKQFAISRLAELEGK